MNPRLNRTIVNTMYRQLWSGRIDEDEPEDINAGLLRLQQSSIPGGYAVNGIRNRRISVPNPVSGIQDHIHPF